MGNILLKYRSEKIQEQEQMKKPFIKVVPNKITKQPQTHNNRPNCNKVANQFNNTRKGQNQVTKKLGLVENRAATNEQILAKINSLSLQQLQFDQTWSRFQNIVQNIFKFNLLFPLSLNPQGQQLLRNGSFVFFWLKIISKNVFINMPMVCKNVREHYLPNISVDRNILENYLKQFEIKQQNKTPLKNIMGEEPLKRSILKNSQKKVKFGSNQILYPHLEQYKGGIIINTPSNENKKKSIRAKNAFILDYFQINDIFLLEQVEIVGVIKEYENTYAIMQIKQKKESAQKTCIGIISKNIINSHSLKTLQMIEKQFENLCYLELEGRDPSSIWVDSLPNDHLR